MTQSLHPATQGFEIAAALYQHARPNYPAALNDYLKTLTLTPHTPLLDLGSGTGKFLPYLLSLGHQVIAADPVAPMLAQLQQVYPEVQTLHAQAEQLPLPDQHVALVSCAQSFHWFAHLDALKEIHRVLQPQGELLLIWNQRDTTLDWVAAIAELLLPLEGDTPRYHSENWKKVFENQKLFASVEQRCFTHWHEGRVADVVLARIASTSFIAKLPHHQQQYIQQQLADLVLQYTGKAVEDQIAFPYVTSVYRFKKLE